MVKTVKPMNPKLETRFRDYARKRFHEEGSLEIDENAPVACGDPANGAYVQAWVWVASEDLTD